MTSLSAEKTNASSAIDSVNINKNAANKSNKKVAFVRHSLKVLNALSPSRTGQLINYLWFKPSLPRVSLEDEIRINRADVTMLEYQGESVPVYRWKNEHVNGKTILFVHGWEGHGGQVSTMASHLVNQGYQVISFDAPAHGAASGSSTNLVEISDIIRRLNKEIASPSIVIAHSLGSLAAINAMSTDLEIEKTILVAAPVNLKGLIQQFERFLDIPEATAKNFQDRMEKRFGITVWQQFDLKVQASKIKMPVMLIHDQADEKVNISAAHTLQNLWPNARIYFPIGLGHNRVLKDLGVIKQVSEFLSQ